MAKTKRVRKKRVSKRRYSRRKTTLKHSKKVYRNKNKRKTRRTNRTKRRMMGGASRQETFEPTHTINQSSTPLRRAELDEYGNGPFVQLREDDDTLSKNTPVYVFNTDYDRHSLDNFLYRKVKLKSGIEGYIRVDFLTPQQAPSPVIEEEPKPEMKIMGEPRKIKHFGQTY